MPPQRSQEQMNQALVRMREKGLRLTAQRKAVLEYLFSTDEHPTARKIFESVRKPLPGIALSTVYGILAELSKKGVIKSLEFNEWDNRYEANLAQHINLICLRCGKISDYVPPYTVDLERIHETVRFRAFQSRFELYGMCETCGGEQEHLSSFFMEPFQTRSHPTVWPAQVPAGRLGKPGVSTKKKIS